MTAKKQKTESQTLQPRPPIVVILGHVDHGKTSILDYIRQSKIAEKESGGITQHIGAYQVTHSDKTIAFIDTPGHEAFSAMRSRGAKVADIAVLVVAAEEGLKPQTKEAIDIIQRLNLPMIIAINKMDKPNALPDKIKKQLADNHVLVESLGGEIPSVFTSAKTGLGINELLDMILLVSEMEQIQGDPQKPANGIIIESRIDSQRGATATLLIRDGHLSNKDVVAAESTFGQIKTMENFLGQNISEALPSMPVLITGFGQVPPVGEEWQVVSSIEDAKAKIAIKAEQEKRKREPAAILDISEDKKVFNFILKADFSGSLEAIQEVLKTIPQDEVILRVVKAEVGDITENDIKLAYSAKARIYGFRVKTPAAITSIAERQNIKIGLYQIIYEFIQSIRHDASALLKPELNKEKLGRIKILATFKIEGRKQIIGGRVTTGKITRNALVDIYREEEYLGSGRVTQTQQQKKNVDELGKDREGGLMVESEIQIEKSDILEAYKETSSKREL
jgi:translation initiation factor IF-2